MKVPTILGSWLQLMSGVRDIVAKYVNGKLLGVRETRRYRTVALLVGAEAPVTGGRFLSDIGTSSTT